MQTSLTRRGLLKASLAAGAGAVALSAIGQTRAAPWTAIVAAPLGANIGAERWTLALPPLDSDVDILNYALTLEHLESAAYRAVLDANVLNGRAMIYFEVFAAHEAAHVEALSATITQLGGSPVGPGTYDFSSVPMDQAGIVMAFQLVETLGASAYLGAGPSIQDLDILAAALSIHAVEAEHASALADLAMPGSDLFAPEAFATARLPEQVMAVVAPFFACAAFPETGHFLCGAFRDYWDRNGGLPIFGYPLTDEISEVNFDTGQTYTVQYFERARFEWHPENQGTPYEVLLGRLGAQILAMQGRDWMAFARADPGAPHYVAETGHAVAPEFWDYWSNYGLDLGDAGITFRESLALFGYPISEPQMETNADGHTVMTQWFERARFEHHPDNPQGQQVLMGRLGAELLTERSQ